MGKPSVPEAPDYSEVIAASQAAAEMSYQIAQDQLAWAQQVYEENKVFLDPIMESYQQTLDFTNATAEADRARYEELYQPLEDQLIAEAASYASPERLELEMGRAQAGVAQQYEASRQAAEQQLESYGLNPADTRYAALDIGTRTDQAAAMAQSGEQAYQQTQAKADALRSEALNIGKGYPGMISSSYNTALQAGQQAVGGTNQTTSTASNALTAPSAYMQTGNQAVDIWGNTINTSYQNQLAQYNAQLQASSGIGTVLGGITSMVMPFAYNAAGIYNQGGEVQGYQEGGPVAAQGRTPSPSDTVPAALTPGEFVVPEDVVRWKGSEYFYKELQKARESRATLATPSGVPIPQPPKGQQAQQGAVPATGAQRPPMPHAMGGKPVPRPQPPMGAVPAGMPRMAPPGMARGGVVQGYQPGGQVMPTPASDAGFGAGFNPEASGAYYDEQGNLVIPREVVPSIAAGLAQQPNQYSGLESFIRTVPQSSAQPQQLTPASAFAAQIQPSAARSPALPPVGGGTPLRPVPPRPVAPAAPGYQQAPAPVAAAAPRPLSMMGAPPPPVAATPSYAPPPGGAGTVPMPPAQVPAPFTRTPQPRPARTPEPRPSPRSTGSTARKPKAKPKSKSKSERITDDKATSAFEFARQGQEYLRRKHGKTTRGAIDTPLMPSARSK